MLMEEMKTYGVDAYNQSASEEQSKAMTNKATDSDHIPLVAEPIPLESNQNHATITNDGVAPALPAAAGMGGVRSYDYSSKLGRLSNHTDTYKPKRRGESENAR